MTGPQVSVVCVVDDHPPDLDVWFDVLLGQDGDVEYEIVMADPFCVDDYEAVVERARARRPSAVPFEYLALSDHTRAAAYNAALERASGALIVFVGPDYIPLPSFVASHVAFHAAHPETTAVGIGSALLVPPFVNRFSQWLERSGHLVGVPMYEGMDGVVPHFFFVGNASVKRPFLESVGPLDERYRFNTFDDYELGRRLAAAGMTSQLVRGTETAHHHPITLRAWLQVVRETGTSARQYADTAAAPPEWNPVVERSPWNHRLRAYSRFLRYMVGRRDEDRERYYKRMLHSAFSAGYRAAG